MKLNTKVNILSTLLTSIILIGSFTGIYFLYKDLAYTTEYEQLQSRADELSTAVSSVKDVVGIETIFRAYIPTAGAISVRAESGADLIRLQTTSEKIDIKVNADEEYTVQYLQGVPHLAIEYPLLWPTGEVANATLIQPLQTIAENLKRLQIIFFLMTFFAMIPIFFASQLLVRLIVKPIERLTTTMERNIKKASYEQITEINSSKDEIAHMALTYNELMAQLEDLHERQQQFMGNASHELKTPLTVIESYAKLLQRRGTADAAVTDEALTAIARETANMKQMIEQMLALAKASETVKLSITSVALPVFVEEIAASMRHAYHREITVEAADITIQTDEAKLKQLLFILLDNARKYSEEGIEVKVTAQDQVAIAVTDYGIGIPAEDIPHIFNRFYRVAKDRNRKTGGTGIGLAVAKELADRLGATIQVESIPQQGTTMTVYLPREGGDSDA